ncbi:MAG: protein kinase, partial [Gemmatimonadota bacterium]|nr:protein kinase [Gemmatimonadota bacterium]
LRTLIKRHAPLDAHVVKGILYQVGSALSYAHRAGAGVIHRDIKPANIMVNLEGDAFVTDFGISKIADLQSGLTQTGATIGTPEYMSPEQCRGELLTGASDQYALGIVAYEMICGSTPFSGSHLTIMMAHAQEPPRPVREVRSDCPPEIAEAVERMLAKSPEDRWPDLDAAVTSMGGAPLGYKDPTRARIVALVRATDVEGASGGVATAPPSVAPAARMAASAGGAADGVTSGEQVAAEASHPEDQTRASPVPATSRRTQSSPTPSRPKSMPSMVAPAPLYRRPATIALALVAIFAIGFSAQSFLGSAGPTSVNERGGPDGLAATGDSGATGDSATQIAGGPGIPIGGREAPPVTPGGQLASGQPGVDAGGGEGEPATADAAADPTTRPGTTQRPEPEPNRSTPPRPTPTRAAPTPSTMTVRLASASMQVGETQVAAAEVRDGSGAPMSDVALSWSSSAPGIVRVNDDGSVRAMAEGSAYVIARTGRVRDSTLVSTVFAVEAVRIAGGDRTVEPGASGRLNAAVLGPEGVALTRPIVWSSSNESVVRVSADGQLAAVAPGVARIRATADGISSDVTVTVQRAAPPPPTTGEVTTLLEGLIVLMTSDRARVMALWPEGRGDAGVRSQFEDRLEREDFRAEVASQEGVRLDGRGAVVSFVVAASHRANFGRRAEGTIQMRAQLLHDGGAWRIVSVGAQSVDF